MRIPILPVRGAVVALSASLLLTAVALGADRPRLRPTPAAPPTPAVEASAPADASPAPVQSPPAPAPPDPGPVSSCLGVERPGPVALSDPGGSPVLEASPAVPPSATPSPPPAKDGGTQRVKLRSAGVRVDVPEAWAVLAGDDLAAVEELPAVAEALAGIEDGSLVLLAADVLPGDGCSVGTLATVADLGEAVSGRALAAAAELVAAGLETLPEVAGDVKVQEVDLPIGPAQRLTFTFDATADGAPMAWWVRLDLLAASGHTLAVGYAAPAAIKDEAKPVVTAIARSLREL